MSLSRFLARYIGWGVSLKTPPADGSAGMSILTDGSGQLSLNWPSYLTLTNKPSLSGTNSGDVTLSGQGYITLSGQALTVAAVDLSGPNATGTLAAGRFPALTGDITTTAGSLATALTVVNADVGTFSGKVTVNAKGQVTAAVNLTSGDVTTALGFTPIDAATRGANNGVATLDSGGKLTSSQIPSSLLGALSYQGSWNASTNSPALASGVGTKGFYYKVGTAGSTTIDGISSWAVGDSIVFDGTTWDRFAGADGSSGTVTTVSVVTAHGISGSVANASSTPAITLTLGAITPTTIVASSTISGSNLSGTNTGDQTITLTSDVTGSGTGSFAATLATVNSNVGSFGDASNISSITVNGKGLITAVSTAAVVAPAGTLSGTTLKSTVVTSSLTSVGTLGSLAVTGNINNTALTASALVCSDGSKNLGSVTLTTTGTSGAATFSGGTLNIPQYATSGITVSGGFTATITLTATTSVTLPTTGTLSTLAGTETMTNKRITPRLTTMADATSCTPAGDTSDVASQTNTQVLGTLTVNAPTGTPTDCQLLELRFKSTNVQTFAWNSIYRLSADTALPTATTGSGKWDYALFQYLNADSKWDILAANFGH